MNRRLSYIEWVDFFLLITVNSENDKNERSFNYRRLERLITDNLKNVKICVHFFVKQFQNVFNSASQIKY